MILVEINCATSKGFHKEKQGKKMATIKAKPRIKIMNSEQVRRGLSGVLADVAAGQDIVIERYAKKVGVVINYDDYEALQQELEDLRDARLAEEVYEAVKSGRMKTVPWEELKEELRKKHQHDE
jgi:prevent-host-death family protein